MRKILPIISRGLLPGLAVLAVPVFAWPADFTRCEPVPTEPDCIPGSDGPSPFIDVSQPISVSPESGAGSVVVFNWPVKNCLPTTGKLRGQVMLVVDNSKSESITDRDNLRSGVVNQFIDAFASKAEKSGINNPNDPAYPKLALMNYNGRSGVEDVSNPIDALNAKFQPDYCAKTTDQFEQNPPTNRWGQPNSSNNLSICEFLGFASAEPNSPELSNMKSFVRFATPMPRGSTDFSYFFKGSDKAFKDVGNASNVGRNVVVVTDGLPNVPKYVAADVCRNTPRLSREAIVSGERLGRVQEYCVDRQATTAIVEAHREALTSPFDTVNVHHVLFTQNQTAYFDYDESGKPTLNPAGFLIENSARTGNGKVKFSYAPGQSQLSEKLNSLFTQFDQNALRYVEVEINPPSGLKYKAVSPAAPGSTFSIKFIGLKQGNNQVKITPVYQDGRPVVSTTVTVNVGAQRSPDVKCVAVPENRTVDGDLKGTTDPKGDGFYAEQTPTGQYRDYRNADEGNKLAQEFNLIGDSDSSAQYTSLRLQGGTGNCGSIAAWKGTQSALNMLGLLGLLSLPLMIVRVLGRRFTDRSERR